MSPNRSSNITFMHEVLLLTNILRKDGDQVLNGSGKLSLSTKLLHNLNDAFTLIIGESKDLESSFQVCSSSEIDLFRDLKFLHDFVQKTIWLKIVQTNSESRISIDITKFRYLRYLELQKVCIDLMNGIQGVRGQLETVSCTGAGGVGTIGRLLAACGADDGVGFVWASLKRLALPYNGLGRLDKSLELAPWLQTLDLSHNFISVATELDCLPSLKYVNLAYNKLEAVPTFSKSTYRSLQVLILKNNYIENIDGLQGLDALTELDLSFNCLSDHSLLWPIEAMTALLWLNLAGNPLSYHLRHRILASKYLHSSLAENKFILDHHALSKSEKFIVTENRLFRIRSLPSSSKDNSNSLMDSVTPNITTGPLLTSLGDNLMTSQPSGIINSLGIAGPKIRKKNVTEVCIADELEQDDDGNSIDAINRLTNSYVEMSLDHLETKKKILALREKFGGENWLSSHGGTFVQDIMGMDRTSGPVVASMSTTNILSVNQPYSLSNLVNTSNEKHYEKCHAIPGIIENDSSMKKKIEGILEEENYAMPDEQTMGTNTYTVFTSYYDPVEEQGELFLVKRMQDCEKNKTEELFLIITSEDIKERDPVTGRIKYRWLMDTILSCVMGRGELTTINFMFDTMRRDRQCRTYYTESANDAMKVVKLVGDSMKARPLLLDIFKCIKCSTHFSQECDYTLAITNVAISNLKQPMCPSCKSTLVIQTDELLTPDDDEQTTEKIDEKTSAFAKNDSAKDHDVITSLQHSTSQSSIGTATSLDDSRESTPSIGTVMKKYESDIEILSNPSQSSIEVLDDGSKFSSTPIRKRSSEERRIAIAPTLLTISDIAPAITGLTESSSSGSLTDSICTTYENKKIKTPVMTLNSQGNVIREPGPIGSVPNSEEPICAPGAPVANLPLMLGGLLQSMKIGTHRELSIKLEEQPHEFCSDMQYSYTNFTNVDHRIKLHLILNIFDLANEELVLLLRSDILMENHTMPFPGCLILSTSKIYVLRVNGTESDDPQRWLQKETSWSMDRLRTFAPLPFKQGILVELQQQNKFSEEPTNFIFLCVLQDFQRTSNLLFYLTDLPLPTSCEVAFSIPEQCTTSIHNLMMSSKHHRDDDAIRIFALFSSGSLQLDANTVKLQIGGILITTSSLILTDDKLHWLLPQSNETATKLTDQAISNLIEVILDGFTMTLNFFDEILGTEELWILVFVSFDAANAVINAIQTPWEELFSVPLQVVNKKSMQQDENKQS